MLHTIVICSSSSVALAEVRLLLINQRTRYCAVCCDAAGEVSASRL
jgi:hypothetical protein